MKYYLKTSNACNLYSIEIAPCTRELDNSKYVVFDESQKKIFEQLVYEFKKSMQKSWDDQGFKKKFDWNKKYYYVTTGYSSHLMNLKVISNLIKKEEDTETCENNYFEVEDDANKLCTKLREILNGIHL